MTHFLRRSAKPMSTVILILVFLLVTLAFTGCNYRKQFENSEYDYGSETKEFSKEPRMYGLMMKGKRNHENHSIRFSRELSEAVNNISGISSSIVMLTDINAYVAIVLDSSASGMNGVGIKPETDNTGNSRGMYNTRTGNQYMDPNKLVNDTNSYFTVYDHEDLSTELKQKIAKLIRKNKPYVREVHISANREFINQMNVFAQDAKKGQSLDGYVDLFNQMAVHYFGVLP
ncbi:YhcN/YlaJ family sporulation lipoprotein [Ferviditalea candida]|uniref:YhcN/YlaJ family sporulation lipoprotein n=1 Tax=Ferviditalea candida TaxID=3108399 RepID=A0ABU5ZIH4_9BACL|nr:YhcN/YlaJ family sporulation lipoprotein [Paenibacillaceae bacterium T2]